MKRCWSSCLWSEENVLLAMALSIVIGVETHKRRDRRQWRRLSVVTAPTAAQQGVD